MVEGWGQDGCGLAVLAESLKMSSKLKSLCPSAVLLLRLQGTVLLALSAWLASIFAAVLVPLLWFLMLLASAERPIVI